MTMIRADRREMVSTGASSSYEILRERLREVPDHFMIRETRSTESHGSRVLSEIVPPSQLPLFKLLVFNRIYIPSKPLVIQIRREGSWFIAENVALGVIGTGESFEQSMLDLEQHIVHFWKYYNALPPNQLTAEGLKLKNAFSNLLTEV